MRLKAFALIGFTVIIMGGLYQLAVRNTFVNSKRNQIKMLKHRLPPTEPELPFLVGREKIKEVAQPAALVPVVAKETTTVIPPTAPPVSLDVVKSWTPKDIIGLAHNDPYLIAYIKTKIRNIPPLIKPYQLANPEKKDFSQNNQTVELQKLFKQKTNGIFVEVGAYDGETFSNTLYWEREYGWTGLLIEPDPAVFERLLKKNRKAYALQACICPTNFANITKFLNIGTGAQIVGPSQYVTIDVPCYPFFSMMAALEFPPIDFFSLDIEGWELKILKTIPFDVIDIRMMMVEFNHIPEGMVGLKKFLEANGYQLHKILAIDGMFVKKGVDLMVSN